MHALNAALIETAMNNYVFFLQKHVLFKQQAAALIETAVKIKCTDQVFLLKHIAIAILLPL
jgi:hypothetical protein